MAVKGYKPQQIVRLWRQTKMGIANGRTTAQACKEAEITVQTYYRWRKEYGDLKLDQAKSPKEPERENAKLKRPVAEMSLERHIPIVSANRTVPSRLSFRSASARLNT